MLTPTAEIIAAAVEAGRGVGAFNVIQLEHAEAIVAGAEAAGTPVILQISQNAVRYHGALEPLALATLAIARASSAPAAVHLDHATEVALVRSAIELGFSSVMFDASALSYADNVAATTEMAHYCHERDVFVEAELGEIGGKDGVHTAGARTDPAEAATYVAATAVDALAVAVGTSHAMLKKEATLDLPLITHLRKAVPAPLVLHGSSGVPDQTLTKAIKTGLTKINIATHLNQTLTTTLRTHLTSNPTTTDPRKYLTPARTAITAEVTRLLTLIHEVTTD